MKLTQKMLTGKRSRKPENLRIRNFPSVSSHRTIIRANGRHPIRRCRHRHAPITIPSTVAAITILQLILRQILLILLGHIQLHQRINTIQTDTLQNLLRRQRCEIKTQIRQARKRKYIIRSTASGRFHHLVRRRRGRHTKPAIQCRQFVQQQFHGILSAHIRRYHFRTAIVGRHRCGPIVLAMHHRRGQLLVHHQIRFAAHRDAILVQHMGHQLIASVDGRIRVQFRQQCWRLELLIDQRLQIAIRVELFLVLLEVAQIAGRAAETVAVSVVLLLEFAGWFRLAGRRRQTSGSRCLLLVDRWRLFAAKFGAAVRLLQAILVHDIVGTLSDLQRQLATVIHRCVVVDVLREFAVVGGGRCAGGGGRRRRCRWR